MGDSLDRRTFLAAAAAAAGTFGAPTADLSADVGEPATPGGGGAAPNSSPPETAPTAAKKQIGEARPAEPPKQPPLHRDPPFFAGQHGLLHGADWNPDQWLDQTAVIAEDFRLMPLANCNAFTLAIFSWTALQPGPDRFTMDWLGEILDRLHAAGLHAILATPSGAKPAWLAERHPEICRVDAQGLREAWRDRHNHCGSSPVYREAVTTIDRELARRFGRHPAVVAWHIGNEFGGACYCPLCLEAFRAWSRRRHGTLDALNRAWGNDARNHLLTAWSQIGVPDAIHGGMLLDWARFTSDHIVDFIRHEIAALRAGGTDRPVTTNLMNFFAGVDYRTLAKELDFIGNDAYPLYHQQGNDADLAAWQSLCHDLMRGLKRRTFLQMECTPSTTNNMPRPRLKRPGQHRLETLQAVAHGADGVLYFQWRKCRGAREKFHGAVVDHEGSPRARVFQEVAACGRTLERLAGLRGSRHAADAAIVLDWEVRWALEASCGPGHIDRDKGYCRLAAALYRPLLERGATVDVIGRHAPLDGYRLLLLPSLFLVEPQVAARVRAFVEAGGTVLATWLTGIVDADNCCHLGGWPGAGLRPLFGIWAEELDVLYERDVQEIDMAPNNPLGLAGRHRVRNYADMVHLEGAEAVATYARDFYAGRPALTRHPVGKGEAWYLAAEVEHESLDAMVGALARRAGVRQLLRAPRPGLFVQSRSDGRDEWLFVLNFSGQTRQLDLGRAVDQETGEDVAGTWPILPWGSRVLRRATSTA